MSRIAKKVPSNAAFRIFNHVDFRTGLCSARLLEIFCVWIEPILSYGSAVWIFKVFPKIRVDSKPSWGYDDKWAEIHSQYKSMMRACACASKGTNFNAVLVRLGMLPLHYIMALRALTAFFRIHRNKAGPAMSKMLHDFEQSDSWSSSVFMKQARDNIDYFQSYIESSLLDAGSSKSFSKRLQQAMFCELSEKWKSQRKAKHTRSILPEWGPRAFNKQIPSKSSESWMMRCCFSQNFTRSFKKTCNPCASDVCRGCKAAPETISHIILECPIAAVQRENLRNEIGATLNFISSSKLDKIFV